VVVLQLCHNKIRMDSVSKESEVRTSKHLHNRGRKYSTVANLPKLYGSDKWGQEKIFVFSLYGRYLRSSKEWSNVFQSQKIFFLVSTDIYWIESRFQIRIITLKVFAASSVRKHSKASQDSYLSTLDTSFEASAAVYCLVLFGATENRNCIWSRYRVNVFNPFTKITL